MNAKRKPVHGGNRGQAAGMETAALQGQLFPASHFTMSGQHRQSNFISRLLSYGSQNGQTLRDLIAITGWRERELRAEIQRERLAGIPILADNKSGYFLPANEDEREQCVKSLRHRAHEIIRTAAAIEQGGMID